MCRGHLDFTGSKPHWKFIHLTNCGSRRNERGIWNVTYTLHMKNGMTGGSREFSADEKSEDIILLLLLTQVLTMLIIFTLLSISSLLSEGVDT